METLYCSIADIYDNLLDIQSSYSKRVMFCEKEMDKLKLNYSNSKMHDNEYFKRFCPLNREKKNINREYQDKLSQYIKTIPAIYFYQDMIDPFYNDLL